MSLFRLSSSRIRSLRTDASRFSRAYAAKATEAPSQTPKKVAATPSPDGSSPLSSCPPNTVLNGLNYLKGQSPVIALPDEEYPPWLWDLLKPKVYEDDGPGSIAEKRRLRRENRQRIRDQNFMKTQ